MSSSQCWNDSFCYRGEVTHWQLKPLGIFAWFYFSWSKNRWVTVCGKNLYFHKRFHGNNPCLINWMTHIYWKSQLKVFCVFLRGHAERSMNNKIISALCKMGFGEFHLPWRAIKLGSTEGKVIFIWFILKLLDIVPDLLRGTCCSEPHILCLF